MPPQTRRGRGRPCKQAPQPEDGQDAASHVPQPPQQEQFVPSVPLFPQPKMGMPPPMTPEAWNAYIAYWNAQAFTKAQAQAQPQAKQGPHAYPFMVPPITPTVPAGPTTPAETSRPVLTLFQLIKEVRQLGSKSFSGTTDALVANKWLKKVMKDLTDMGLEDGDKLKVATRLLDESAATWWENMIAKSAIPLTWADFLREFKDRYYISFHCREKKKEFFGLKQLGKTVSEYEIQLRELAEFVSEFATDENLCIKFEEGLNLEIREKMLLTGNESYKEMIQLALRAEKLVGERRSRGQFQKRKGICFSPHPPSKKSNSSGSSSNASGTGSVGTPPFSPRGQRTSRFGSSALGSFQNTRQTVGVDRCRNCRSHHSGPCNIPPKCFHCEQTGHIKKHCPSLGRAVSVGQATQNQNLVRRRNQSAVTNSFYVHDNL